MIVGDCKMSDVEFINTTEEEYQEMLSKDYDHNAIFLDAFLLLCNLYLWHINTVLSATCLILLLLSYDVAGEGCNFGIEKEYEKSNKYFNINYKSMWAIKVLTILNIVFACVVM